MVSIGTLPTVPDGSEATWWPTHRASTSQPRPGLGGELVAAARPSRDRAECSEGGRPVDTLRAQVSKKLLPLQATAGIVAGLLFAQFGVSGEHAPFEPLYRQAYEQRLRQLGAEHPKTIASLVRLGALLAKHGRAGDAEPLLRRALAASEAIGTGVLDASKELAITLDTLGRGREAEDLYLRSLESGGGDRDSASTLVRLAALRAARAHEAGALASYREALAAFEHHQSELDEAGRRAYAEALNNYGLLLESVGDTNAATIFRRAVIAYSKEFGERHPATAAAQANLAGVLASRGETEAAVRLFEQALVTLDAAFEPLSRETARVRNRLGEIYETEGRFSDAEAAYRAALAAWAEPAPERGLVLADLGRLLGVRGDFAAAESALREAVEVLEPHASGWTEGLAEALDTLGSVLRAQSRLEESESTLRRALALREKSLGPDHVETALTLVGLAGTLHLRGDLRAALPLYRRALRIQEESLGPNHPDVGETLFNLAHVSLAQGDLASAKAELRRSFRILSAAYGPSDPFVIEVREALQNL